MVDAKKTYSASKPLRPLQRWLQSDPPPEPPVGVFRTIQARPKDQRIWADRL